MAKLGNAQQRILDLISGGQTISRKSLSTTWFDSNGQRIDSRITRRLLSMKILHIEGRNGRQYLVVTVS